MHSIETLLLPILQKQLSSNAIHMHPIGGGSINHTYKVKAENKAYFIKVNSATKFPHLFEKEAAALQALERYSVVRIPKVIINAEVDSLQLLLMEWIDSAAPGPLFWKLFGQQLALLHQVTQYSFGWKEDNYMGAIKQSNTATPDWSSFFITNRLQPLVQQAHLKQLLTVKHVTHFETLYSKVATVFNDEPPSLLHGDLWNGNFLCSTDQRPVLIDPAIYFGHRSIDMGMTTLFGGFAPAFYEAYHYHFPLPANHKEQWQLANLYPLLIHLLLFGKSYLPSIERTLNDFQ